MPGGFHIHDALSGNGDAGFVPRVPAPRYPPEKSALGEGWGAWGEELRERLSCGKAGPLARQLEQFQFETLRISNHTACRFAEKARFFRSLWAGRRCAAASRFTFFKGETL